MSRRPVTFACEGATLFATLDEAPGTSGLLWVGGGNEIRSGAWAGQAQMAARIAAAGHPVLRFDRRGVGDSEGENRGFRGARDDIAAALAAFRAAAPSLSRIVAFGNCDAASALMLFGAGLDIDALALANPWVVESDGEALHAPAAIRRRYAARLADPRAWRRLLRGGIDLRKLAAGLRQASASAPPSSLAEAMRDGLARFGSSATVLLAERDRTAELFAAAWPANDRRVRRIASASHSFADPQARDWLFDQLLMALRA